VVPDPGNPQDLNRYTYVGNNPLTYIDPTGHALFVDPEATVLVHPVTGGFMTPFGVSAAVQSILQDLGGVNDLEGMAITSEVLARPYPDWESFLPQFGQTFVGSSTYGPPALIRAILASLASGGCCGVGREPHDCASNKYYWQDTGFHQDFRDRHNQPYHAVGHILQTASPGAGSGSRFLMKTLGFIGNVTHEWAQSKAGASLGWGTSWEDYVLSEKAWEVGALITNQAITPAELGDVMRSAFGPGGTGSNGRLQMLQSIFGPLAGTSGRYPD